MPSSAHGSNAGPGDAPCRFSPPLSQLRPPRDAWILASAPERSPRISQPKPFLEPAAREFCEATPKPPYLFDLGPAEGRKTVDEVQSGEIARPDVDVQDLRADGVSVRILRPRGARGALRVILYMHGAGWVFGNPHTHDRLVRELSAGTGAAAVFPDYSLSPEARYPTALEEVYTVAKWVAARGAEHGLDGARLAVAGDSVGGNRSAALTLLAKERSGPALAAQVLFYPVTDASFDTGSYRQFAEGYFLRRDAMQWFWDQYTTDAAQRAEITASPAAREQGAARRPTAGALHHRRGGRAARRGRPCGSHRVGHPGTERAPGCVAEDAGAPSRARKDRLPRGSVAAARSRRLAGERPRTP